MSERKVVKNLKTTLKELEGMVKNPKWLQTGRDLENFKLRPRELWANWLLSAVIQKIQNTQDITFAEGSDNDDGMIVDQKTGAFIITEHVMALDAPSNEQLLQGEARIIERINIKIDKGPQYAKDKLLIVFFDGLGEWYRNKVREAINGRHSFKKVYLIGLLNPINEMNGYNYSVTELRENDSITFKVHIDHDFNDYSVIKMV